MAGEPYASVTDGMSVGPPNIGLSPEQIRDLSEQARVRIAAENAVKEAQKAERAQLKAAAKKNKSAARENIHDKSGNGKSGTDEGLISDQKQEKTGLLGLLKNLLKKNKEDNVVR